MRYYQLMIDPSSMSVAFEEVRPRGQGPPWFGQSTQRNIMRRSNLPELNLRPGFYAHRDLKQSGKFSNAVHFQGR